MNVALWAEIRRLAEIEKLSGRAIARRLHCSWRTVTAVPRVGPPPRARGFAPRQPSGTAPGQDQCTADQVSRTLGGAHPRGDRPRPGRLYRQRLHAAPLPAADAARPNSRLPGSSLRASSGDAGRLGRMWSRADRRNDAQGFGVRGRALLQPADVHRVHTVACKAEFYRCLVVLSTSSVAVLAPSSSIT